jgi:spore germination cell wall hydrolase CwlJ-like protein
MLSSPRSALLILTALGASSVAPAQVTATTEPMVLAANNVPIQSVTPLPIQIDPAPPAASPVIDPLAPLPETVAKPDPVAKPARQSGDLASLVAQMRSSDPGSRELECLAVGIYFESKSEPLAGQLAVGEVIANRANSKGRFPSSYCGVLFQRSQFSFIRGRALPSVPRSSRQWSTAVAIAKIVDQDLKDSAADKALFFHAKRVSPGWKLKRVASIGNHIFYR